MKLIYLDNAATTAPDKEILAAATEYCADNYYNPSALYREGRSVRKTVEDAREVFMKGFKKRKIVFTSCGTEADLTAVNAFAKRGNVVTTEGEHAAIQSAFELLKRRGTEVRFAKLKYGGAVDEEDLLNKIDGNTSFVSVVHVNNETGAINDVNALASAVKKINPRAVFHTDAVQSFLKIPYVFSETVDLISVSAHKIKALKGCGALIYNENLHFEPFIVGGGQENGMRSGTENVLGIKVFADAYSRYSLSLQNNYDRISDLKSQFIERLDKRYFKILSPENSSPYLLSLSAVGLKGEIVQREMDDLGFIIGKGSACSSKNPHSRVIRAFEKDVKVLDGVIRISFIFDTDRSEALSACDALNGIAEKLYGKIVI